MQSTIAHNPALWKFLKYIYAFFTARRCVREFPATHNSGLAFPERSASANNPVADVSGLRRRPSPAVRFARAYCWLASVAWHYVVLEVSDV